jgi:hypothetical protein
MSLIPLGRLIVSFDGPSARQQDIHTAIAIQIGALRHQPAGARLDERFHVRRYLVVVQVREEGVLRRAMPPPCDRQQQEERCGHRVATTRLTTRQNVAGDHAPRLEPAPAK